MVMPSRIRNSPPRRGRCPFVSTVGGRIIAGFGLLVVILVTGGAVSAWVSQQHRSDLSEMEMRSLAANLLEEAALDSTRANLLLERYLVTGSEDVLPAIRLSAATAAKNIADARSLEEAQGDEGGEPGSDEAELERLHGLAAGAAALSATFEEVIALKESDDADGAREALEAATPEMTAFGLGISEVAELERGEIMALRSRANRMADLTFWSAVVAGAVGAALGLTVPFFIARSILRPLSSLESTALAVAAGDLGARARSEGPHELVRLGASLNQMTDSLLDASKRHEPEEERVSAVSPEAAPAPAWQ